MLAYLPKNISDFIFFQNREFGKYFCKILAKKRIKSRGSQEMERMSTQVQARSPEMDVLICVPENEQSQQAAGVPEMVVGVEDPLQMSDTEQDSADSEFQSAIIESQRGITELKDIVAKKLTDNKVDNPRLGFCDFLKEEVVQLTSHSYDEFQQEMFNLLMRLKQSEKQQRYHHRMGTNTATYSQASNQYQVSHTQMHSLVQVHATP